MSFSKISAVASAIAFATKVAAHGTVSGVVADGVYYPGYNANFQYMATAPVVVGWSTPQDQDNGFIAPDQYSSPDIICHRGATNAGTSAKVAAGGKIDLQWTTWPESHHGPMIDYLANCNGDCTTVDKTALEFFKIDGVGLIDGSAAPGKWASDEMIANNNTWSVTIPSDIAPGSYVLRHETIALHSAGSSGGAQNYPQCINLEITGSGTASPSGVKGTALYTATDPGILINIYTTLASYIVPGPPLFSGASSGSSSSAPTVVAASSKAPAASSPAPAVTKAPVASPKPTSVGGITAPGGAIPSGAPFLNSTTKASACKVKTSGSVPVASAKANSAPSSVPEQATPVTIPTVSSSASKPSATNTKAPSSGSPVKAPSSDDSDKTPSSGGSIKTPSSGDSTTTSPKPATSSAPAGSTSAPEGTTLATLLSWVSSFYTKHADTEFTGATIARRAHARDVVVKRAGGKFRLGGN
ncbi:hypothetical protein HYFRA_00011775 [Hymenoscyphus fraxineus]|uniref:Auxiliary Activity family 9 catalytic domain-containing protein n=1 Tax=Hymenoscyphus fraxineus TaxID=746836 RepID=A0A9N9L494_9HELO|nr:hypothetical protein HYFRA_00011775 [Hymenoscyphus fraxineus]